MKDAVEVLEDLARDSFILVLYQLFALYIDRRALGRGLGLNTVPPSFSLFSFASGVALKLNNLIVHRLKRIHALNT